MNMTDEMLSAYLDKELDTDTQKKVAEAIQNNPSLRARLQLLERATAQAVAELHAIDERPLPAAIEKIISSTTVKNRSGKTSDYTLSGLPQWVQNWIFNWPAPLATAAVLIIGLGVGFQMGQRTDEQLAMQDLLPIQNDKPLYQILNNKLSGKTVSITNGLLANVVLSFRTADERYCREFTLQSQNSSTRNIACREPDGQWQMIAMTRTQNKTRPDQYQPATGVNDQINDQIIDTVIDNLMEGQALDQAAEQQLIKRNWQ